ncbi:MAG: hypothetical protein LBS54_01265 [Dysgonamonadaceae bacterium]|jgi:hypothetical protein|nr:hypothetical protein [Dysgonamonadaceae bacterium]
MTSKKVYYLPARYALLLGWSKNFINKLAPNIEKWGVPADVFDDLRVKGDSFNIAQMKTEEPNAGKTDRFDRNVKAKAFKIAARDLVNEYLRYNRAVTDQDRIDLGIPVEDSIRTNVDVPDSHPVLRLRIVDSGVVRTDFKDQYSDTKAKPYGVKGAVFIFDVLDTPPVDHSELSEHILVTRTPHRFEFEDKYRNKTLYVAAAWQNEKGERGRWSDIESITIP